MSDHISWYWRTYTEYPNDHEENDLEKVPIPAVGDLEHDELSCSKRVHRLLYSKHMHNPIPRDTYGKGHSRD